MNAADKRKRDRLMVLFGEAELAMMEDALGAFSPDYLAHDRHGQETLERLCAIVTEARQLRHLSNRCDHDIGDAIIL